MEDRELPLMGRIDAPSAVPTFYVQQCRTYREAVRMAWALRRVKAMKRAQLAERIGAYAQHVSDFLHPDDRPRRRNLPPDLIPSFEDHVGNTLVSQWLAWRSKLTVLEEMQATRLAA